MRRNGSLARDTAVLALLYGSGLRISEALSLERKDAPIKGRDMLRVTGKGNKTRVVPVLPIVREAVERYLALCPLKLGSTIRYSWACAASSFRPASSSSGSPAPAWRSACPTRRRRMRCAIPSPRISWAPAPISRAIQELLGHASLSTTQGYTEVDRAHLLKTYDSAHPRA